MTAVSAPSFKLMDFCLICVPFDHYDKPEILRYAINSICPTGADVGQTAGAECARQSGTEFSE
jgi:hypothetical protein